LSYCGINYSKTLYILLKFWRNAKFILLIRCY